MARGQVTGEAGRDCLIVYMVMKCAGFLPSYMTAIGAWQETRKGSAVATVFETVLLLTHLTRYGQVVPFPSRRVAGAWTGSGPARANMLREMEAGTCPRQCRPPQHRDEWTNC